jgi:hypothetical protein
VNIAKILFVMLALSGAAHAESPSDARAKQMSTAVVGFADKIGRVKDKKTDLGRWRDNPNTTPPEVMARLRKAAEGAAKDLDKIACDNGDADLADMAIDLFVLHTDLDIAVVKTRIFTLTCNGRVLRTTIKLPR